MLETCPNGNLHVSVDRMCERASEVSESEVNVKYLLVYKILPSVKEEELNFIGGVGGCQFF